MAIGWLSVLQMVPWSDVIHNAPKVAEGAKKLWGAVAGKPDGGAVQSGEGGVVPAAPVPSPAQLQAQLAVAEAAIADLHQQMLASSELIQALADQNNQLIQRAESHRIRLLWLSGAVAVVGLVALAHLGVALWR